MANLVRLRVAWTGDVLDGSGVSTFYWDEAHTGFVADAAAFFNAIKASFPIGLTWTFPTEGDLIDVATGELSGTWTDLAAGPITATGSGAFARGVGARVAWATSGIRNGRRVRGSTFLCPLGTGAYEAGGTLANASLSAWNAAVQTFLTASAGNQRVYSRPSLGQAGQSNTVIGGTIPDRVSWLRSRRT